MKEPCPMMAVVAPGWPWALTVDEQACFSHGPLYDPALQRGTSTPAKVMLPGRTVAQGRAPGTVAVLSLTPSQR